MHDANSDPAGLRGNHARIRHIAFFFDFNAKKCQPVADPRADCGAFSPMPLANTSESSPSSAAAKAPASRSANDCPLRPSPGTNGSPVSTGRFLRNSSNSFLQAAACALAVLVKTPSRSNRQRHNPVAIARKKKAGHSRTGS